MKIVVFFGIERNVVFFLEALGTDELVSCFMMLNEMPSMTPLPGIVANDTALELTTIREGPTTTGAVVFLPDTVSVRVRSCSIGTVVSAKTIADKDN